MTLLIAFIAGMLTLLSPCTLPVIPFVFAGVRGSRMVLMFTAVALLVSVTSHWVTGVTAAGRWIALGFLTLVALTLLSSRMAQWLSRPLLVLGNRINDESYRQQGLAAALLSGMAIGLLWSPCAGPILGAILSLSVSGTSSVSVALLLTAYGSGCAAMLALLWFAGRELLARIRPGMMITTRFRQLAGGLMLGSVALVASGAQSQLQSGPEFAQRLEQRLSEHFSRPQPQIKLQPVAVQQTSSALPSLTGDTGWLNGEPLTPDSLKGKVVLIDFWTFDCINCQHTLPHVRDWANKYQSQGLVVVGVHTPEYPWERDAQAVSAAIARWKLPYAVVTDNNYAIWNRFGNQYWPAHYIFDAKGQLRYTAFGEGDYEQQEQVIQQLLSEARS